MEEQRRRVRRSESLTEALAAVQAERRRVEGAIKQAARRREKSLEEARVELDRIGDLAMDALDAGSTAAEIIDLAGISRRTLYKLLDERGYSRHRE